MCSIFLGWQNDDTKEATKRIDNHYGAHFYGIKSENKMKTMGKT